MPRIIIKSAKNPKEVKPQGKPVWLCQCGLSQNQPFCDNHHNLTADEKDGELYQYDDKGGRELIAKEGGGCCEGGCCKKNK